MKLFNKRCWIGHNGVVGITLKVLLLLFATKITYAHFSGSITDSDDPVIKRGYWTVDIGDVLSTCNSQPDGGIAAIAYSIATRADQVRAPFLAAIVRSEVETDFDYFRSLASEMSKIAYPYGATLYCRHKDGFNYLTAY